MTTACDSSRAGATEEAELAHRLRDRARNYGDFRDDVRVRLVTSRRRPLSTLYRYQLTAGDGGRSIIVKVPRQSSERVRSQANNSPDRPRLFSLPDASTKATLEYAAMSRIHQYFSGLNDSRFFTVATLDFLTEDNALVMEAVQHPTLSTLLLRANRLRALLGTNDLVPIFRNAGAWLRQYHELPNLPHTRPRSATRESFCQSITHFVSFLRDVVGPASFFDRVSNIVEATARQLLPPRLPLGMCHGDFAPRNILVAPNDSVAIFDTLARWRAPIFEDIACFLLSLSMDGPQIVMQGLLLHPGWLEAYRREFLCGYFAHETPPQHVLDLFEAQALLDKWAGVAYRLQMAKDVVWLAKRCRFALRNQVFRRHMQILLSRLEVALS